MAVAADKQVLQDWRARTGSIFWKGTRDAQIGDLVRRKLLVSLFMFKIFSRSRRIAAPIGLKDRGLAGALGPMMV